MLRSIVSTKGRNVATLVIPLDGQTFTENCELKNENGACVYIKDAGGQCFSCKNSIFTYDDHFDDDISDEGFFFGEGVKDKSAFFERLKSDGNTFTSTEKECGCANCRGWRNGDY